MGEDEYAKKSRTVRSESVQKMGAAIAKSRMKAEDKQFVKDLKALE